MNPKVVVVGSFVQDLTWKCAGFPQPGETVIGEFVTGPGGKGSNQAVAAGRAGVATAFIGAVGRDLFADGAAKFYRAEGIGARFAPKVGHATGTAAILVNKAGENEIVVALGASEHLRPARRRSSPDWEGHDRSLPARGQPGDQRPCLSPRAPLGRRDGTQSRANAGGLRPRILQLTDVLIPNESEFVAIVNRLPSCAFLRRTAAKGALSASTLLRMNAATLGRFCRALGVPTVIVTLGRRGCFISTADGAHVSIPGHTGVKVLDTTGAGDAFVGGFAAGFVKFRGDIVAAARHGNAVAALSVTRFGTAPAMPRAAEIRRFLAAKA